ncbi:hypothetical protein NBRC110019_07450 [Neptunitalea chrysea]|uniref:Phage tail tube protein n=1 Tax=Neptunitalea chrysea TaxID=1647581 RepID=A0A9W6B358_9FLAO|nr:hypothetical protein [Neptunitalea chrysea]GLB51706.1 hypothetical protein NBRC110019_07450 [Neptunitalea chrysea]
MPDITVTNKFGTMQGWNSVTVNLLGRDLEGITGVNYDDNTTKEHVRGVGSKPIGRSKTDYEATASITLYKEEVDAIQAALPLGKSLSDIAPFNIIVMYEKEDGTITKDIIMACEFTGNARAISQGDGTISNEYTLITSEIIWNAA